MIISVKCQRIVINLQKKSPATGGTLLNSVKFRLEGNTFFHHHFPQVDQTVAHATQGRIDAAVGQGSNFLEAPVSIVAKNNDFALIFGEQVKHPSYTVVALPFHDFYISSVFSKIDDFENVPVIGGLDGGGSFHLAEMIHAEVVCNAHCPGKELAFFCIPPTTDGVDNLNQNILENVLSQILVFDEEENRGVQLVLVADYEGFKSL